MRRTHLAWKTGILLSVVFLLVACNPLEDDTKSDTLLIVEKITAKDLEGNEVNFLNSDVLKINKETGEGYVTADAAKAVLRAALLDPAPKLGASVYNDILVTRYVVTYTRSDGKNTPGVDVPYPIEGSLSVLVRVDQTAEVNFIVVKETAKLEPPLRNLAVGRGDGVITVTAKIDFYGQDMTNHKVKATGYLLIEFANYYD